ncbi:transcriptional regulator, LacI family [Alkalispirochaeta americana]|uniref:Transcriptional regulator, LacI family n=1 Tax=Alkalispirochaeta americana TaxID=159291 RepID=A0A1N6WYD2_9SPIO|nr:LacI family DNA-binding transcriptional regulator [Alkalispirochaeta americana]SIQ95092.1 transcriptional regulator, LacI family [Alkalispirochaeta americana]
MERERSTIKMVARDAGVSQATVSRVLNQPNLVKPETRDAVYAAMAENNYVPPAAARPPAEKQGVIGLALHDVRLAVAAEVIRALSTEFTEHGFNLMLINTCGERNVARFFRDHSSYRRTIDGLIAFSMKLDEEGASFFHSLDLPIVLMQSRCPSVRSISTNNYLGGRDATEYLLSRGYHHIAFVGWDEDDERVQARLAGYRSAIAGCRGSGSQEIIERDSLSEAGGHAATLRIFEPRESGRPVPDAVFYACDTMAVGGLRFFRERRIAIPEAVGVVGFDDISIAPVVGLTTMQQFFHEKARLARTYLERRISGRDDHLGTDELSVTPRIMVRETTR